MQEPTDHVASRDWDLTSDEMFDLFEREAMEQIDHDLEVAVARFTFDPTAANRASGLMALAAFNALYGLEG